MKILVTRPEPLGSQLGERITEAGHASIYLPLIDIISLHPIVSPETIQEQEWIIFVSPQAVFHGITFIKPYLTTNTKIATIGKGTADALQAQGVKVDCYPKTEWNTEGLLALPEFQTLKNKRILLVKGEGGREKLAKTLKSRGAFLKNLMVYRRNLSKIDFKPYQTMIQQKEIDVIVCTSKECITHLKNVFGKMIYPITLLVSSERLSDYAKHAGFQTILLSQNAGSEAIIKSLNFYHR